jgi:hypothetical protein
MIISQTNTNIDDFRAILTSPFTIKKVSINSYTPFNPAEPLDKPVSQNDFPEVKTVNTSKLRLRDFNVGVLDNSKNAEKIIRNMIQNGYSAKNALDIQKAVKAYGLNMLNSADGIETMNSLEYEV